MVKFFVEQFAVRWQVWLIRKFQISPSLSNWIESELSYSNSNQILKLCRSLKLITITNIAKWECKNMKCKQIKYNCKQHQPISTKATTTSATSGWVRPPSSANAFELRANSVITATYKIHTILITTLSECFNEHGFHLIQFLSLVDRTWDPVNSSHGFFCDELTVHFGHCVTNWFYMLYFVV